MANVRCPVCSTLNTENQENCLVCGARLRVTTEPLPPIRAGQEPTAKTTSELERTLPGWLRDLRSGEGQQPPASQDATPEPDKSAESAERDLLAGLSGALFESETAEDTPPEAPADFLSGLLGAKDEEEEDVPDWLKALQSELPQPMAPVSSGGLDSESDASDWFSAPPEDAAPPVELPTEPPALPEETSQDVADWLRALDSHTPAFVPEASSVPVQPAAPLPGADESPDWLADLGGEALPLEFVEPSAASSQPQPAADISDWFTSQEPPAAEPPDWLSALGAQDTAASQPGFPSPAQEPPAAEPPDWLSALSAQDFAPAEPEPPTQPISESALDDADWLTTLGATPAEPLSFDSGDLPAWLSAPDVPAAASAETPDWLSGSLTAEEPTGQPAELSAAPETGFTLPPEPPLAPAFLDDTLPGIPESDTFSMEMPDWLSGIAPPEMSEPALREEEITPDLSPAELPSWVQSMRPVESVITESSQVEEGTTEQKGPLAGLRNVLPMPGLGLGIRKPPAYANKLDLDESQQAGAALLESIMTAETAPSPVKVTQGITSARVLRWVISLVMLLAVTVPAILNLQFVASNTLLPPETLATANQLGSLPPGVPLLVVIDYEPGLSGEMEAAAAPVIDHLMVQGVNLAFVSTSPSGPLLIERLIGKFQSVHHYQPNINYVNLGYLPGGPAGIAAFAAAPTRAIQYGVDSVRAWETEVLSGVTALDDFSAVLVVTDSVDTGRAWVEQTGPALAQTPLVMAISAQAEPIIRPYYDAGQVKGLVTGLVGGAAYEQVIGKPGLGRQYWDALSSGFLVAEIFIVAGSLWGLFTALRARRIQRQDDEGIA